MYAPSAFAGTTLRAEPTVAGTVPRVAALAGATHW